MCYIHVGTHKTGTTSIQAFLRDNEAAFAAHGVLVPRSGRGEDAAGHHNLTQELLAGDGFVPQRGGLREVSDELRRSGAQTACISSEDFSLVSNSAESLTALREAVEAAGFTPIIVIYLRPQLSYCASVYAEIVKNGNPKPFTTYLEEVERHGSFVWNGAIGPLCWYDVILERFAAVFGERAIIVRRYRSSAKSNALLRSFAELVIGRTVDFHSFVFPPERYNPTLSFHRVLRAFGRELELKDMRFAPFNLREAIALAASFYPRNREIARCYGVWVPPCEIIDLLLALGVRKTFARTLELAKARRALRHGTDVAVRDSIDTAAKARFGPLSPAE